MALAAIVPVPCVSERLWTPIFASTESDGTHHTRITENRKLSQPNRGWEGSVRGQASSLRISSSVYPSAFQQYESYLSFDVRASRRKWDSVFLLTSFSMQSFRLGGRAACT